MMRVGEGQHNRQQRQGKCRILVWGGLVVAVSVEDPAEGERDRSTRLFEVEERSKVPEKEVTAKIKRERE
jgi:hypothetical protein